MLGVLVGRPTVEGFECGGAGVCGSGGGPWFFVGGSLSGKFGSCSSYGGLPDGEGPREVTGSVGGGHTNNGKERKISAIN